MDSVLVLSDVSKRLVQNILAQRVSRLIFVILCFYFITCYVNLEHVLPSSSYMRLF